MESWRENIGAFRYKSSPLVEAVCEFGFPAVDLTPAVASAFGVALGPAFSQELRREAAPYVFRSADQPLLVQLTAGTLTVNHFEPYPGVFGVARDAAEAEIGSKFGPNAQHEAVRIHYDSSSLPSRIAFAANLRRLHADRVRADYYAERTCDTRWAEAALLLARELLTDLASMQKGSEE